MKTVEGMQVNMPTKTEMLAAATVMDSRWAAVVARNRQVDGKWFYSVKTTGVYCRPSCATNALAVAIPCHHVVRNDGALSGYRWGVERTRVLLEREAKA